MQQTFSITRRVTTVRDLRDMLAVFPDNHLVVMPEYGRPYLCKTVVRIRSGVFCFLDDHFYDLDKDGEADYAPAISLEPAD